jgi:hypothetical protein
MKPIDHSETSDADTRTRYDPHKAYADKALDANSNSQKTVVKNPTDPTAPPR